jgi:Mn-containing catalase
MFAHNKRLQYTVRVSAPNPGLANLMLEQFGGPQGELAAAMRYFTQAVSEDDPGRKDMLFDIATEELSHLEIIGHIVAMLNKGAKGDLAEAVDSEADMYKKLTGAGNDSHVTQVLYGAGSPLVNSAGVPWTAAYIDTIGEPTADLRSNIAAESRAKIVYERLIALTDDPGIKEALGFLMTREIAHQKSFEKALYSIEPNFPRVKCRATRASPTPISICRRVRAKCAARGTRARSGTSSPTASSRWRSTAAPAKPRSSCRQGHRHPQADGRAHHVRSEHRSADRRRTRDGQPDCRRWQDRERQVSQDRTSAAPPSAALFACPAWAAFLRLSSARLAMSAKGIGFPNSQPWANSTPRSRR